MEDCYIIGNVADNPVVEDVAHYLCQQEDYSDLVSLKNFLNTEFCPRYIVDERSWKQVGNKLEGKKVIIISTTHVGYNRDELAMRNCLLARGAKDNGADRVILVEPDLFYSAQDRGPRKEHGYGPAPRHPEDYKKFDGQPFSAKLYAELLKTAGVDEVVTVHNHSCSVQNIYMDRFSGSFHNLLPSDLYSGYMRASDVVNEHNLVLCAPDNGALDFVREVHHALDIPDTPVISMKKNRESEREVSIHLSEASEIDLDQIAGKDIVVVDDMVRTGNTIIECCHLLKQANPRRVVLFVTHFYSSRECRSTLNDPHLDEIVTTSTIPEILNRDVQGRLRHKMVVLQISKWISSYLIQLLKPEAGPLLPPLYAEDMSSKNPRWQGKMGPLFSQLS